MSKHMKLSNYLSQLPDFVFEYIEHAYQGESVNTQIGYSIDIKIFLQYLQRFKFREIENLEDFTPSHMEKVTLRDFTTFQAYLREYETECVSPRGKVYTRIWKNDEHGINRKLSGVRGLFSYLYKHDMISHNESEKIDFKKIHQKMKRPMNSWDTVAFLDCLYNGEKFLEGRDLTEYENRKQRDIALFVTYLGTGCRVSELINLNINDVDLDTFSFIVTRKGGDQQEVFMPVQVHKELSEYLNQRVEMENAKDKDALFLNRSGKRISAQGVEKIMHKYCLMAGISDPQKMHPHALRRTFACNLIADGIDIKMVAELMGHKNIEVTHKYYTQYAARERKKVMREYDINKNRED